MSLSYATSHEMVSNAYLCQLTVAHINLRYFFSISHLILYVVLLKNSSSTVKFSSLNSPITDTRLGKEGECLRKQTLSFPVQSTLNTSRA